MLESLGLSATAEAVYRVLLAHQSWDVDQIAAHLKMSKQQVKIAHQQLIELALLTERESRLVAVPPSIGLSALLASAEAEMVARRQQIEATRAAVMALTIHQSESAAEPVRRLASGGAIAERMRELGSLARREVLLLGLGDGELRAPAGTGVRRLVRASIRHDPALLAEARGALQAGAEVRMIAAVPMPMAVYDRATALLPVESGGTAGGMLEVANPGVVAVAGALFDELWFDSAPLDPPDGRETQQELDPVQRQLLRMLAEGHTDELVARRLGVSLSTVRRTVATLMGRLEARSRFQAGIRTVERGWLAAAPAEDAERLSGTVHPPSSQP